MHGFSMPAGHTAQTWIAVGSSIVIPQRGGGTRETRQFGFWRLLMRSHSSDQCDGMIFGSRISALSLKDAKFTGW